LAQTATAVVSNLASFLFSFFLLMFSTFYLLKDGEALKKYIMQISPISSSQENVLIEKISMSITGIVKGTFLVALTQAIVALIGFVIFGVPSPFLWAGATFLAAFIPNLGTALVIIPAVVYLFLVGDTASAIGLSIWGGVAVGLVDNFISPRLIGKQAEMHPLLVLLSVLGGLQFFGVLGFILGPIAMAIVVAVLSIYKDDVRLKVDNQN
jgi:predicted PurR-regulated permease PerM